MFLDHALRVDSLAFIDIGLFVINWTFQLTTLIGFNDQHYEAIGTGCWSGLMFLFTGLIAWRVTKGFRSQMVLGVSLLDILLVVSVMAFCCGWNQLIIFSLSIDDMNALGDSCDKVYKNCGVRTALDAVLLVSGLIGIFVNAFITFAAIKIRNNMPPPNNGTQPTATHD